MGAGADIAAGIMSGLGGLVQAGVNIWRGTKEDEWNERNFDYQKALQQQIFEREDTAIQRRMADLKAAGLNPNLAAGQGAAAGAVVGRSNTSVKDINVGNPVGTALDVATAVQQLRAQREQNQILKNQQRESKANADMAENERVLNSLELYNMLGLTPNIYLHNGKIDAGYDWDGNKVFQRGSGYSVYSSLGKNGTSGTAVDLSIAGNRLMDYLNWQYTNNKNSAALLQKDVDWYTADKIANYAGTAASIFSGIGSGYRNFRYRRK